MDKVRLALLIPLLLVAVGCTSTHVVPIKYQAPGDLNAMEGVQPVTVGNFADGRGTDSHWLGAIRGGYGNVLKRLVTSEPTSTVVHDAFVAALGARHIDQTVPEPRLAIDGKIVKLDCSYFFNREAHAHLQIDVVALPTRTVVYSQLYKTDNTESGVGAGIFGDPIYLAQFEEKTINETIDKVFADPMFIAALTAPQAKRDPEPNDNQIAERLRKLDQLKADGLITDQEYESKRKELLKAL